MKIKNIRENTSEYQDSPSVCWLPIKSMFSREKILFFISKTHSKKYREFYTILDLSVGNIYGNSEIMEITFNRELRHAQVFHIKTRNNIYELTINKKDVVDLDIEYKHHIDEVKNEVDDILCESEDQKTIVNIMNMWWNKIYKLSFEPGIIDVDGIQYNIRKADFAYNRYLPDNIEHIFTQTYHRNFHSKIKHLNYEKPYIELYLENDEQVLICVL